MRPVNATRSVVASLRCRQFNACSASAWWPRRRDLASPAALGPGDPVTESAAAQRRRAYHSSVSRRHPSA